MLCNWVTTIYDTYNESERNIYEKHRKITNKIRVKGKNRMQQPNKKSKDVLKRVRKALEEGSFEYSKHALEQREARNLSIADCERVLRTGSHEPKRDRFKEQYGMWTHSITGKTIDGTQVRIIIAFDVILLIVTVINLDLKEGDW